MVKLVLAIIHDEDAFRIMDALCDKGYSVTKLASTGGFLRAGNTTLICGVDDEHVHEYMRVIESKCNSHRSATPVSAAGVNAAEGHAPYPVEVTVGGATIFVLDVEEFRKV